ncbi:phosphorylase [Xylophilus sp. Kf1]|nr:phosphorylase [Xylophilus sp. Kf1]
MASQVMRLRRLVRGVQAARRWRACAGALAAGLLAACASPSVPPASGRLDDAPRVAVVSAFEPELVLLRRQVAQPRLHSVQGVEFTTGTLAGKPVVLFLSGVSMVNAAMNTQRALDLFNVSHVVFSGIAGGVDPALHIGDVTVPARWGQYLEVLAARETSPGRFAPPARMGELPFAPFGMFYPRPVELRTAADPQPRKQFWFPADAGMLQAAQDLQRGGGVTLASCDAAGRCLRQPPRLTVGGNGVSGASFMDNAALRRYTFETFAANVIDMESAATAQVATSNGVPFIVFRSLSDLAGGGEGENEMGLFLSLAAENSARVLLAFLDHWKP